MSPASTSTAARPSRILVVDDTEMNRDMLSRRLAKRGYAVEVADGGRPALERIQREAFDLILLDIMMPDLSGVEVLKEVRQRFSATDLPVIMATAKSQSDDIVQALHAGASDYVTKPLDFPVVLARVETQLTVKHSVDEIRRLQQSLHERHAELSAANARIKRDLDAAARVQQTLLPSKLNDIPGLEFAWRFQPCQELGGDGLNIMRLDDEHVGFYIVDVTGHGVASALLSFSISHELDGHAPLGSVLTQPIPGTNRVRIVSPAEVAATLTAKFPFDPRTEKFFTMFYGVLHVTSRELRYVSAGSPSPILLRPGQIPALLASDGLPIGIAEIDYEERTLTLQPGDRLFLYSDGVSEAMSPTDEVFGMSRLVESLQAHGGNGLQDQVAALANELAQWQQPRGANDDITLLALEVTR
jgi:sigma-B regulation protein RsbU (phosphoserine phosphatase)